MIKSNLVNLGARVPSDLKKILTDYCERNGIKMQFFVSQAISEKLAEAREDQEDVQAASERLKDATFAEEKEMSEYLKKRNA